MQWGVIFGDGKASSEFSALPIDEKVMAGAAYLYRQKRLVEKFDASYGENLTSIFESALLGCVDQNTRVKDIKTLIEGSIPDTDEFPEEEGTYAQNLFISLAYLVDFSMSGEDELFEKSVGMAAENIDLINYELDSFYADAAVLKKERLFARLILDKLSTGRQGNSGLSLLAWLCSGNEV